MTKAHPSRSPLAYDCPIEFLQHCYQTERQQDKTMTWERFAKKLGISRSLLKLLMAKKRNFTLEHVHRIAFSLRMNNEEHEYFEACVMLSQAGSSIERAYYRRRMERAQQTTESLPVHISCAGLKVEWYLAAFLVYLFDFCDLQETDLENLDLKHMTETLGVSEPEIKDALENVKNCGILKQVAEKKVMVTLDQVHTAISTQKFVRKVAEESLSRLKTDFQRTDALFYACAFSMTPADLRGFVHDLKGLLAKVAGKVPTGMTHESQKIYQGCFNLWPTL